MVSELARQDIQEKPQRDIAVVTKEIKEICAEARRMMLIYAVEVGRRLVEAKEILPHGEWGEWLKNEVEFSQSTANKHMKLFEAFGNPQISLFGAELNSETFTNLSYSQALKLLAVPDDEREDFVKENDIENKSIREIDRLIKERDEAKNAAGDMEKEIGELKEQLEAAKNEAAEYARQADILEHDKEPLLKQLSELRDTLTKAKEDEKKAKAKLKELKENPEIPEGKIAELRANIEKENAENNARVIEEQLKDIKAKLEAAEQSEIKARREAKNAENRISDLEKQIKIADPAVAEFRTLFNHIQDYIGEAKQAIGNIKDRETADRFRRALGALADQIREG